MKQAYRIASKFFAMVHLGYIPIMQTMGLCYNVELFTECHDIPASKREALQRAMTAHFTRLGLHHEYPVEGAEQLYADVSDKYRGRYARQRRELAKLLAVHFKGLADES